MRDMEDFQNTQDDTKRAATLEHIQALQSMYTKNIPTFSDKPGLPTYHYLLPNDSRGRDVAAIYPNGDLGVNLLWLEGETLTVVNGTTSLSHMRPGILPGTIVIQANKGLREISLLKDKINISVTDHSGNKIDMQANEYHVLDAKFKKNMIYSIGGQLLAERFNYVKARIIKEFLGVAIKDTETIYYDIFSPYLKPIYGVLTTDQLHMNQSRITQVFVDKNYEILPEPEYFGVSVI